MSSPVEPHVVLGATGGAGSAVVRELVDRDLPVRAVSRTDTSSVADGVEAVTADCLDADQVREVCTNAATIYHCVNLPYRQWHDHLPTLADNCISAAAYADAPLVVADNLYMYGPTDGPMTEDTPRTPDGTKGKLRAELENQFVTARERGQAQIAIGRASDFYGPRANSATRELVFETALDGVTAAWLGALDAPHSMSYLPDIARGLVTLGTHEEALGEIWHLPSNDPVTGRHFIEMVYSEAGVEPSMRAYGYWMLTLAGLFDTQIWEAREVLYQFQEPFVMDTSKYEAAFGRDVTPYETAIRDTLDWHRALRA